MIRELTTNELGSYLRELMKNDALELTLVKMPERTDILIPYMMNDAVEYYLRLWDCDIRGEAEADFSTAKLFFLGEKEGETLMLRYPDGESIRIRYQKSMISENNYQYHRIGHRWREKRGEDHWRRLVNILCVLHDKMTFLGDEACNPEERELYRLIEFAPLCFWTPVNESINDWYPETLEGIRTMKSLAAEAGNREYEKLVDKYEEAFLRGEELGHLMQKLAFSLKAPEQADIYYLLEKKIEQASIQWPRRSYSTKDNARILKLKQSLELLYRSRGYRGQYPLMEKTNPDTGEKRKVFFVEEQPFTVLESEEYKYRIFEIHELP